MNGRSPSSFWSRGGVGWGRENLRRWDIRLKNNSFRCLIFIVKSLLVIVQSYIVVDNLFSFMDESFGRIVIYHYYFFIILTEFLWSSKFTFDRLLSFDRLSLLVYMCLRRSKDNNFTLFPGVFINLVCRSQVNYLLLYLCVSPLYWIGSSVSFNLRDSTGYYYRLFLPYNLRVVAHVNHNFPLIKIHVLRENTRLYCST